MDGQAFVEGIKRELGLKARHRDIDESTGRRDEVVALGLKSIVAGTLATCLTGAVVGMFWTD